MKKLDFDLTDDQLDSLEQTNAPLFYTWLFNKMKEMCQAIDKLNEKVDKVYKKLFSKKCDHVFRESPFGEICAKCGWNNSMPPDPNDSIVEE